MALADAEADPLLVADALEVADPLALELALPLAVGLAVSDGEAVVDGDGDALLVESPEPEGMSAVAVVAHAVAASTAAIVEQARSTRPWDDFMTPFEQQECDERNRR